MTMVLANPVDTRTTTTPATIKSNSNSENKQIDNETNRQQKFKRDLLSIIQNNNNDENHSELSSLDDLNVAETHVFRPVFKYRVQSAERRRIRQPYRQYYNN